MYEAWSVVAFETPTAAKWNILGTNDESFHTGDGIDDDAILTRHLGEFTTTTDANGWRVRDNGFWKIYTKRIGPVSSSAVGAHGVSTDGGSHNMPVGVAPNAVRISMSQLRSSSTNGQFGLFIQSLNPTASGTSEVFAIGFRNLTTSSLTPDNYYVDIVMVTI